MFKFSSKAFVAFISMLVISLTACAADNIKPSSKASLGPSGQTVAVSLTYDDAIPVHHQKVAPLLQQHGSRGTFYLTVKMVDDPKPWQKVAQNGHELGNHALFHPCRREPPEAYTWLPEYYDLVYYDLNRFRDELTVANKYLDLLDGGKTRTYGNTCLNQFVGQGESKESIKPVVDELFVAARGQMTESPILPESVNYSQLGHFNGDGKTFEQIKSEIEAATANGGWVIYMFHGVGEGTHPLFINQNEHQKLIEWLGQKKQYWVAPVADVATRIKAINSLQ